MTTELELLVVTAFTAGAFHTLIGPDHYVPFVAMAKSGQWSYRRTLLVTTLCGIGHIAGSVILGAVGLLAGMMVMTLETVEALRGELAGWLLIAFGASYLAWGLYRAIRYLPHVHLHANGWLHSHPHGREEHAHAARESAAEVSPGSSVGRASVVTPWLLFLIFVFGPCEVLIPLLMYPAAEANWLAVIAVVLAFSVATLGTMIVAVLAVACGLSWVDWPALQRYSHALAGLAVLACGLAVKFGL